VSVLPNSAILVGSQTLTQGQALTTGSAVVSLGPAGVVIGNIANDVQNTIIPPVIPTKVGHLFGITISAALANPTVALINGMLGTQSVTLGGSPITIFDNQVATLASSGLVVAAPNGAVSTFSLAPAPTEVPTEDVEFTGGAGRLAGLGMMGWVACFGVGLVLGFH
jgi:hypothetical protein